MALIRIGDFPLPVSPSSISWTYTLNHREFNTLAGKVVQLLSCKIDSLSISGNLRSLAELERFERFVMTAMMSREPLSFSYPARDWYARVRLESFPSMSYAHDAVAPSFGLTMMVDEGLANLARESKNKEFDNIMAGVQWSKSKYNDFVEMPEESQAAQEERMIAEFGPYTMRQIQDMIGVEPTEISDQSQSSNGKSTADTIRNSVIIGEPNTRFDEKLGVVVEPQDDNPFMFGGIGNVF